MEKLSKEQVLELVGNWVDDLAAPGKAPSIMELRLKVGGMMVDSRTGVPLGAQIVVERVSIVGTLDQMFRSGLVVVPSMPEGVK